MQNVELDNAKVYFLQPDNQFATKLFLERQDTTTNYLIYAPFPKPDVRDNHLEDTLLYSKRFFADRASLLSVDLGIDEKYKPIIEKHIKFFANKERTQRFYDLEIENFNEENIITGLLSAICRTRTCSFEEVIRVMLTDGELADNKFLYRKAAATDQNGVIDPKATDTNGTEVGTNGTSSEYKPDVKGKAIMQEIQGNSKITQKDICAKTGIPLRTVKRTMSELQKSGKLRREGTNRNGSWVIINQKE